MTVLDDVAVFARRVSPRAVCDDSLTKELGLSVRQHANQKTRILAVVKGFTRHDGVCYRCKSTKLVISCIA